MADAKTGHGPEQPPLVTIIIPCWNGESYVSEAISSAIKQQHEPLEIIFVDDGSSDSSLRIAQEFCGITIISQKNSGVSVARNVGLERSIGEYILFLDADDRLHPEAVRLHLSAFSQSDAIPMVYGANRIIDSKGRVIGENLDIARRFTWKDVLMGVTPTPSQSMFRRNALITCGAFNAAVNLGEDFDLYLRLVNNIDAYCHNKIVVDYRIHPSQATKQPSASLVSILDVIDRFISSYFPAGQETLIWRQARRHWSRYYGQYIPLEMAKSIMARDFNRFARASGIYVKHFPHTAIGSVDYFMYRIKRLVTRQPSKA